MTGIKPFHRLAEMPLRVWLRIGIPATILWLVFVTLLRRAQLEREIALKHVREIAACRLHPTVPANACLKHAAGQLVHSRANALPLAIFESILELILLWFVGAVLIVGARWFVRSLGQSTRY